MSDNRPTAGHKQPLSAIALAVLMLAPLAALPAEAFPAPHWSLPLLLNPTQTLTMSDLEVHVAEDGSAMAVWQQSTAAGADIFARRYTQATGWQTEASIDGSANYDYGCTVRVAGNREGDVAVTWLQWNGSGWAVMAALYTASWGWAPAIQVSSNSTVYAVCDQYAVAINEVGDAAVAWQTTNGTVWHVRANRFNQGSGWFGEEVVAQMVNSTALDVNAAVDDGAVTTVVWGENNGSDEFLHASRAARFAAWSAPALIFQHFDNGGALVVYTDFVRIVSPLPGVTVIAWRVYNGTAARAIWEVRYIGGAWTSAAIISEVSASTDYPSLDYSVNGTTTLTYRQSDRMASKWYVPGGSWTGSTNITGVASIGENVVAVNAVGQAVLVWEQYIGAWHVFASTYSPWSGWTTPQQVDYGATPASSSWVSVGIDQEGDGISTWPTYTGSIYQPWASKLTNADPDPLPLTIDYPRNRESVGSASITVRGQTAPGAVVEVNGVPATVGPDGTYAATLALSHGWTRIVVNATGKTGPVAARAAWVAYTDPGYAYANETADASTTGWTPVRAAGGAVELSTVYTSYGGSVVLTFSVSYGANGDGMAYWVTSNGTALFMLYAAPYVSGIGWQTPRLLSAHGNAATNPDVFTDASGRSMVVWDQNLGNGNTIYAARYERWTGWAETEDLTPAPDRGYFPRAAMGTGGQVFVTYARTNASGTQYAATRYIPGNGWQQPAVLGPANAIAEQTVSVAGAAGAAAAWANRTGGISSITAYRFDSGTSSWGSPVVALANSTYVYNMQSVISSGGAQTITYRTNTTNTLSYNLTAVQSDNSNSWAPAVDIDGPLNASTINWHYSVGIDANGNVTVIFLHVVGGRQRPLAVQYFPGTGWGATTFLDSDTISKNWVMGDVSADGTAIAAWSENNGTQRAQAARYVPGEGWRAPEFITAPGGWDWDVVVAMTTGGRALVVSMHFPSYGCCYSTIGAWRFTPPDETPPPLSITSPANNSTTAVGWANVRGNTEPGARVWVNGFEAPVAANGSFAVSVPLVNGTNVLRAFAKDGQGNGANATVEVSFLDPVLAELVNLTNVGAALQGGLDALQVDLDTVNATLAQAIADVGATTVQQLADLNATLLAALAAQNATLAAEIGSLNATLLAELALLNGTLMDALTDQNATLWAAINAAAAATAAGNQALADAINATAAALRAEIAALRASQNLTDANVTGALARIAGLEARLTALAGDLNLTHDELLALIDGLAADIDATRAAFNARLDGTDANVSAERSRVNAALDTLEQELDRTRNAIGQTDANLTAAIGALGAADEDLGQADAENQQATTRASEVAQGAKGFATIVAVLAAAGLAVGLVAALLAMRARRPAMVEAPPAVPVAEPAAAAPEEVRVGVEPVSARGGSSLNASSEAGPAGEEGER